MGLFSLARGRTRESTPVFCCCCCCCCVLCTCVCVCVSLLLLFPAVSKQRMRTSVAVKAVVQSKKRSKGKHHQVEGKHAPSVFCTNSGARPFPPLSFLGPKQRKQEGGSMSSGDILRTLEACMHSRANCSKSSRQRWRRP